MIYLLYWPSIDIPESPTGNVQKDAFRGEILIDSLAAALLAEAGLLHTAKRILCRRQHANVDTDEADLINMCRL